MATPRISRAEDPARSEPPVAVIYNGKGACAEGCASSIARIARKVGLQVRYVSSRTLNAETLRGAALYIQPGGDALEVLDALGPEQIQMLGDYVRSGGRYLGICAGAFLADTYVDDAKTRLGLGLLPGETIDFHPAMMDPALPPPGEMILENHWVTGILPGIGGVRQMYFSEGAGFQLTTANPSLEILAYYADQTPSSVRFLAGNGKVLLTGVHPEAPKKWWNADKTRAEPLVDPDGEDHDIARAMLQWLLAP